MRYLRSNTAVRVTVGPFFSNTDGVTPKTSLTVTACKLTFMVDDANVPTLVLDTNPTASGGSNDMIHVSGDDAGFYDLELAAANVNYLGRAMLALTDATNHCPVFHEFMILPAMIYDSLVLGTDRLDTNVTHVGDTSQTARDLGASVLLSTGTGTGQLDFTSGVVKANTTQFGGSAITSASGRPEVNTTHWNGTAVASPDTAGYVKATVKVGTGTGEINLSSGAVPVKGNVRKNTALAAFPFMMTDSTNHAPATTKTVTVTRSIDGGAFAGGTLSAVTEVANGIYVVDFGAGDLNGNTIILRATATGCDDTFVRLVTDVA